MRWILTSLHRISLTYEGLDVQLWQIKHGLCWRQSTVSVTCRDSTDYRDGTGDNTNYKDMGYYHGDVTEDDTPSDCDNYSTSDQTTYTGSTRGANPSLPGSKQSRHLHLMGKHKLHTGGASDTLQFYLNLSAKRGDLSVLTERQLDTNSRNRHLNRGRWHCIPDLRDEDKILVIYFDV